ncbi:3-hydroxyacyl-CoA dehydrogenase [Sulfitobacter noctilucicola]|uniref:3-hydroxyacyl-CoA dehydrogenase n=1 Tax=Sulfitobacter noctilucicola TaxID=1342301 RepID=A0A7W6M5Z7_9RHOB|nr:3-hydroxyacyl-CoA dehydrogenase family protein [Sulfitobacter noctilucicola]KIN62368.1 3-hydroxyacyl-CoA dehydrogenase [Sulfitobacter noctilucicola]MBB4173098.1 3-hydroxyacyl-CoA dehydrogenase [Sulfitobacter noctilucicola]
MIRQTALLAVQDAFWMHAETLLFHHTNPWELDEAMVDAGYAMGPCEAQDLVGLEKVLARHPDRVVPVLPRMVAEGRMGKGGGVGYYRYPGGGGAVIDPLIEDLILEEAWFGKIARSEMSDAEIVSSMNSALRDVLANLKREGITPASLPAIAHEAVHCPLDIITD